MKNEDLKDMLNKKIGHEFYNFKQILIKKYTPEQIIKNAYEIAVKEQIVDEISFKTYENVEIRALLKQDNLIDKFYDQWLERDIRLGNILENSIDETVEDIMKNYQKKFRKSEVKMVKKYQIEIEEILQHIYEIEAETLDNAIDIAEERYGKEEYILSPEDLKETNISEYREEKNRDKRQKNIESR